MSKLPLVAITVLLCVVGYFSVMLYWWPLYLTLYQPIQESWHTKSVTQVAPKDNRWDKPPPRTTPSEMYQIPKASSQWL